MEITPAQLPAPTPEQRRQWAGEHELRYALHIGSVPLRYDIEMEVDEGTGKVTHRRYAEPGDCTLYIDSTGLLLLEYFQQSPGSGYWDPPEDRITLFTLQCVAVEAAKHMAAIILTDIEIHDGQHLIDMGFSQEVL